MTVWIVEDDDLAAEEAATVAVELSAAQIGSLEVYWDKAILWEALLSPPPPAEYRPEKRKSECPPTIVILDLFDDSGEFRAEEYLRELRMSEARENRPRCWVILWSVYSGRDQAQEFISKAPERDRRVLFSGGKQTELLRRNLEHCWSAWKETQYL